MFLILKFFDKAEICWNYILNVLSLHIILNEQLNASAIISIKHTIIQSKRKWLLKKTNQKSKPWINLQLNITKLQIFFRGYLFVSNQNTPKKLSLTFYD